MAAGTPAAKQERLRADPMIAVGDLEKSLAAFFKYTCAGRDLRGFLKIAADEGVTWSTAARSTVLSHVSPLFKVLAEVATNGVLPGLKMEKALAAVDADKPINLTAQDTQGFCSHYTSVLKMMFAQFRDLKTDAEAERRCYQKASQDEIRNIDGVLDLLCLREDTKSSPKASQPAGPVCPTPSKSNFTQDPLKRGVEDGAGGEGRDAAVVVLAPIFYELGAPRSPRGDSAAAAISGIDPQYLRPDGSADDEWDMIVKAGQMTPTRPPLTRKPRKGKAGNGKGKDRGKDMGRAGGATGTGKISKKGNASKQNRKSSEQKGKSSKGTGKISTGKKGSGRKIYWKPPTATERKRYRDEGLGRSKRRWTGCCRGGKEKRGAH